MKQNHIFIFLLALFTLLAGLLRFHALSPFRIYPDSYQNLLIAQNIAHYHSVVGYLGTNGMLFPPFVMWSRPGYPLAMLLFNTLIHNDSTSAQAISLIAGILAIPITFFLIKRVFKNSVTGLLGAFLLAVSFNHTAWSGFIMTETTGVLLLLLALWSLQTNLENQSGPVNIRDIGTGLLLGSAILTRYEYALFLIPLTLIVRQKSASANWVLINIATTLFLYASVILTLLFPLPDTFIILQRQTQAFAFPAIALCICIVISWIIIQYTPVSKRTALKNIWNKSITGSTILFAGLLIIQTVLPSFAPLTHELSSLRNFVLDDVLISCMFFFGIILLLRHKALSIYAHASILSALILGMTYYHINFNMERYWTHLLPFFLIPAAYGFSQIVNRLTHKKHFWLLLLMIVLIGYQLLLTYNGFRTWGDRSWYTVSYEETAAREIKKIVGRDTMLITSFPEPYYYFTKLPTQSIADTYPYIYIEHAQKDQKIIIVQDMGMHDLFPHFSNFLTKKMTRFTIKKFKIDKNYHYGFHTKKEVFPIILYQTTLADLQNMIKHK